jgi:hypothetical protein
MQTSIKNTPDAATIHYLRAQFRDLNLGAVTGALTLQIRADGVMTNHLNADPTQVREIFDVLTRTDADRRLVQTAPVLLEACRAALQALTSSDDESHFDALALETMLTAAIARAEGGSDE